MSEKKTIIKKRNWAFILYPESAPANWREQIQETGLEACISPLHNKDIDNDTKEIKKAHYHVILCYNGPTSYNVVNSVCKSLNCSNAKALESVKGYYRYLTHMDNPEKYQYDKKDIEYINNFNVLNYFELTKTEISEHKRNIQQIIRNKDITEYCDLLDFLIDENLFEELDVAMNNVILFNSYIKSRKYKQQERKENKS